MLPLADEHLAREHHFCRPEQCKNGRIFPFKYNRHEGDALCDQLLVSLCPRSNECSPDREHCIVAPIQPGFRSRASAWFKFNLRQYGIRD